MRGTDKGGGGYRYEIYIEVDRRETRAGKGRLFIFQFQLLKNHGASRQFYVLHLIIFSTWSRQNPFSFKIICNILEKSMKTHIIHYWEHGSKLLGFFSV